MTWGERCWRFEALGTSKSEAAELQELRAIAELARTARLIGVKEENIILGAVGLSVRPIREIILPAEQISMLDLNAAFGDSLIAAHLDMHNRYPVTERGGDPQAIVGYVNFKDMVSHLRLSPHDPSLRAILRTSPQLPDDLPISGALERLMREHTHIALVRDGTDKVLGMITLEDIIEELVGDIQDEFDMLPMHAVAAGSGWVVGGGIKLDHLRRLTGLDLATDLPATGAQNVSEWVIGHLGRAACGGDIMRRGKVRVLVRKVRRQQVQEIHISREAKGGDAPRPPTHS
jgi:putative hemolysin